VDVHLTEFDFYFIQGSYFEMTIPWCIENASGYTTKLNGNLMKVKWSINTGKYICDLQKNVYWSVLLT